MSVIQEARSALCTDREMTLTPLRVLLYLESILGYENYLRITQQDIVVKLGIHRSDVSRAMKLLLAKGIVEKLESPVIRPVYRLNPNYGWRGKHEHWKAEKAKARPLRLVTAA